MALTNGRQAQIREFIPLTAYCTRFQFQLFCTAEHLGSTDRGITLYRRMLLRELRRVEDGEDPKTVQRDPAENAVIHLPLERTKGHRAEGFENLLRRHQMRYSPIADEIIAIFAGAAS